MALTRPTFLYFNSNPRYRGSSDPAKTTQRADTAYFFRSAWPHKFNFHQSYQSGRFGKVHPGSDHGLKRSH